jgi:lipopolysaccharide export system permease protein
MRTLDRYLAIALLRGLSLALLVLVSLFSLLAFVRALEAGGGDGRTIVEGASYVALTLPQRALDLAPVAALLGALLGLGTLGRANEIVVMLTSGLSLCRFAWAFTKPILVFAGGCALMSEFVAPPLHRIAETYRSESTDSIAFGSSATGKWLRDGRQILHVPTLAGGRNPNFVELYDIDPEGRLAWYVQAERADVQDSDRWILSNVRQKLIHDKDVAQNTHESMAWKPFLTTQQFEDLLVPAKSLSPMSLYRCIRYLKKIGQSTNEFEMVFWQKAFLPLGVASMALLALPFGLALLRNNVLDQMMIGGAVGVALHLVNLTVVHIGAAVHFSAPIACAIPIGLVLGLTGYLFRRVVRNGVISVRWL